MFHREHWFAWFPVTARSPYGKRIAWLETVVREHIISVGGTSPWRYYAN